MCIDLRTIDFNRRETWTVTRRKKFFCPFGGIEKVYFIVSSLNSMRKHQFCKILQLDKLEATITEKQPELANRRDVVFHHNNAKPYVVLAIREKLIVKSLIETFYRIFYIL